MRSAHVSGVADLFDADHGPTIQIVDCVWISEPDHERDTKGFADRDEVESVAQGGRQHVRP